MTPVPPSIPIPRAIHFWIGLALIAVSWSASWSGSTPLAHHGFFPLWLGYILFVDGIVHFRTGTSLFTRGNNELGRLFVASIPLWWLFEALNARLDNWSYVLPGERSWLGYHAEATLAFSTVVPALFETSELYRSFGPFQRRGRWMKLRPSERGWALFSLAGSVLLALALLFPDAFFPLVWIGLFFLVDPIVHRLKGRSIAAQVEQGYWGTVLALFAAGLTCGFFWEMWNSRASPKWLYDIAYAERFHLFEMPLLGYGGYLPFALETYALVMLMNRFFAFWSPEYLQFDASPVETPI